MSSRGGGGGRSGCGGAMGALLMAGLLVWFVTDYDGFEAFATTFADRAVELLGLLAERFVALVRMFAAWLESGGGPS